VKYITVVVILFFTAIQGEVFQGKLGKYDILMLNDRESGTVRYSYTGKLVGIPLYGKDYKKLCEPKVGYKSLEEDEETELFACFNGAIKSGVYRGRWEKEDSQRSLPFVLKQLQLPKKRDIDGDRYTDETLYYEFVEKGITFKKIKKVTNKRGVNTTAKLEPITQIKRSRILLKNKKVQNRINTVLDKLHKQEVMQQIWCVDDSMRLTMKYMLDERGEDMDIEYYESPFLLISYSGSISCEGAHPNNYYDQYLFDLRSGQQIDLREMFGIYTKDTNGEEMISQPFKRVLQKYLNSEGKSCYDLKSSYYSFELNPVDKSHIGVWLRGMGHAGFACETEPIAVIPLNEMQPLADKRVYKYFDFKSVENLAL